MPPTSERMAAYAREAPELALAAIDDLRRRDDLGEVTHLVVASCTGFVAPGIDQVIARRLGLSPAIERTLVGFMGCYAAVAALRVAHHIVRSDPAARVLLVTVELCSLHLQDSPEIVSLLAQLQFADGAAAALVSSEAGGIAIDRFFAATLPDIEMLLELGVSTRTEVSLLTLGLSRTSAVELFAHIADDELSPEECRSWLAAQDLARLDVPELVRREVDEFLRSPRRR